LFHENTLIVVDVSCLVKIVSVAAYLVLSLLDHLINKFDIKVYLDWWK